MSNSFHQRCPGWGGWQHCSVPRLVFSVVGPSPEPTSVPKWLQLDPQCSEPSFTRASWVWFWTYWIWADSRDASVKMPRTLCQGGSSQEQNLKYKRIKREIPVKDKRGGSRIHTEPKDRRTCWYVCKERGLGRRSLRLQSSSKQGLAKTRGAPEQRLSARVLCWAGRPSTSVPLMSVVGRGQLVRWGLSVGVNTVVNPEGGGCQPSVLLGGGKYLKGNPSSAPPWSPQRHVELGLTLWEGGFLNSQQSSPFREEIFWFRRIVNKPIDGKRMSVEAKAW